jgi:hypothetical protein
MGKVTFDDKVDIRINNLPEKNKVTASTINDLKNGINALYDNAIFIVELIDALSVNFYSPEDIKITSIEKRNSNADVDILINNSAYTIGNNIIKYDKITVISDINTVVKLNVELL